MDNAGFNLYRATSPDGPYDKTNGALIAAEGAPVAGASYSFLDEDPPQGTCYYKLEDVDYQGVTRLHGPVPAGVSPGSAVGESPAGLNPQGASTWKES